MVRFLTALFAVVLPALAAGAYEVKGTATDSVGEGLPYVTYKIYTPDGDKALTAGTAGLDGSFAQSLDSVGDYRIELLYTGMATFEREFAVSDAAPVADLGRLVMHEGTQMLEGVTVTAQRPLVVKEIDRIGYDVQADPETPTSTLNDILRKVPMVSVESDGTIKVNGSTDFKIYKNGRPNNSLSRNAKELFAALPASMIKRVEVITEPGAEYDAEGTSAILNIITDNSSSIKGVLGSVSANWDTNNNVPGLNAWITTEINKVTFNVYGGYHNLGGRIMRNENESTTEFADGSSRLTSANTRTKGNLGFFGFDGSFQLDTLNLFTAELGGYCYDARTTGLGLTQTLGADGSVLNSFNTRLDNPKASYIDIDANFNYQHNTRRKGEIYTFSYLLSHTSQNNQSQSYYEDVAGMTLPYSAILSKYKLGFYEHTVQADWTRPFGDHKLNFGAKGIFRRNHSTNTFDYVGDRTVDDEFSHVTNIAAIYGQYSVKVRNVTLRAGLRYEYSHLKASYPDGKGEEFSSDLSDLVPSAAASWQINDANSLSFNYSTSISRPGIDYLNPAVTISPTTSDYGNPDLGSARRQSMKLSYMLIKQKVNMQLSANYSFSNNGVAPVIFVDDNNIINSTYANVGHRRDVSLSGYIQWSVTDKTRLMLNASATWARASLGGMTLCRWSPSLYGQLRQDLPWKIQGQLYAFYWGGGINGVYSYNSAPFSSALNYGLSLSRGFLKDDRLNVRLSLDNPIGPSRRGFHSYTVNGDYTGHNASYRHDGISLRISVSYRFGSLRASVKKTATSIENDDLEQSRPGAGQSTAN